MGGEIDLTHLNQMAASLQSEEKISHLQAQKTMLEAKVRDLLASGGRFTELIDELKGTVIALDPYPRVNLAPMPYSGRPVAAVVVLSDWQTGEKIDPAETEGFGEFNWETQQKRVFKLQQKVLDWVGMHRRAGYNVSELHIFSVADLVSGNIHYELEVTNEFTVMEATANSGWLLGEFISRLEPHFAKTVVWEISADNHGRITRKNQWKKGAKNNFSWLAHVIANGALRKHDIEIVQGDGTKILADVLGKKFLLQHGHQIKSQLGMPYYGIDREVGRESLRRMGTDKIFHYLVMGHFHVPSFYGNVMVGGNLPGTTELDHALGRHSGPSQTSFMVHPEHGVFDYTPWRL